MSDEKKAPRGNAEQHDGEQSEYTPEGAEPSREDTPEVYGACPVKRKRRSKEEMEALTVALFTIVKEIQPATVRQIFYQAVCRALIEKTEKAYDRVQTLLVTMRRNGTLPYEWIVDLGRGIYEPYYCLDIADALEDTISSYRLSPWLDAREHCQIWIEKNALRGVIEPVTTEFVCPLIPSVGFSSDTQLYLAAQRIKIAAKVGKPSFIYQLGDHDPSGVSVAKSIESELRKKVPGAEIHFERVAVTEAQIELYDLPMRPTKMTDSRAKGWIGDSVELDAIHPEVLRDMVRECILRHVSAEDMVALHEREEADKARLREIAEDAA